MPTDIFAAVQQRYGLHVPELYRSLAAAGHLDPRGEDLAFSDLEWLTPADIADHKFLDWQTPHKTWCVPFAISGRHDEWAWRLDWANGGEPPVVFCEWGPEGYGYAPGFRGFLYRKLLEELSGSWLLEHEQDERGKETFARSLKIVLPHLPQPWAARLKKLAKKPWHKDDDGTICVFPRSECDEIVEQDLAFEHLNEKFWQEQPPQGKKSAKKTTKKTTVQSKTTVTKKKTKKSKAAEPTATPLVITGPDASGFGGGKAGQTREDNGLQMVFCWCPAGTFQMGSPPDEPHHDEDEGPVRVTLTQGFWLGKYQVTQGEFEQLTGSLTGTFSSVGPQKDAVADLDTSRFPVERITWDEATEFCQRLSKQERGAGRLPANWDYRLPAEAQWEYACRAGTTSATTFGDSLSSKQANFDGSSPYNGARRGPNLERPTTVGSYPANAWGLHDMHGNVLEFCRDEKVSQLPGGQDPEVLPARQVLIRVVRGGGWRSEGSECRSAFRYGMIRTVFDDVLGFRVALVRIA